MDSETILHLITASVSPAVMISGTSMLVLAFLSRQGILTGRLRELHDKALQHADLYNKEKNPYYAERAALSMQQASAVYARTRNVKWTLIFLFIAIIAFVMTSISLGLNVVWSSFIWVAAIFFVVGMASLSISTFYALSGAMKSLTPLQREHEETERLLARIGGIPDNRS